MIGTVPDYLLANQAPIPEDLLKRYRKIGAMPLYLSTKEEKYLALLPQIQALLAGETDEVARMSNIVAMLNSALGYYIGLYLDTSISSMVAVISFISFMLVFTFTTIRKLKIKQVNA